MKRCLMHSLAAVAAVFVCGCSTTFDYVGRSFPEKPENAKVAYFTKASQIPAGKYKLMGKGLLTAPVKFDKYDIKETLLKEARKRGASAVLNVSQKKFLTAWNASDDSAFAGPNPHKANPYNLSPDGTPQETNSFGNRVEAGGINRRKKYGKWEWHIRAQFYCTAKEMDEFIQRRSESIENMINAPADELEIAAGKSADNTTAPVKEAAQQEAPKAEKAAAPQQ